MSDVLPAVLLVDDVEANLIAVQAQLARLPCRIVCARSGNDALRLLLHQDFAVMLLDVQMPEMDGFEVAKHARENPTTRDVPIIFVTAMNGTHDAILQGYSSGGVDILFKPVNPDILRSKVTVFLELDANRRRLAREVADHRQTMAELEAFNYSVSHDLRAPLRPLLGYSKALIEEHADKLDAAGLDQLQRIHAAAARMSELIDDLLRLSQVSRTPLGEADLDLAVIARSIGAELKRQSPDRRLTFEVAPTLPAKGDPGLIRIVLENLLRNAWKFTAKVAAARVEFTALPKDGVRCFVVRDNGAGFSPAYSSKLFKPFQRLHSSAEFEGTGIGLAIVHRIVRRHGGEVWAESEPGAGASFYFTLGGEAAKSGKAR